MARILQDIQGYARYCPGEEAFKISDAICYGRRRGNFPKCKGCQFNDEEAAAPVRRADSARPELIESIFGAYDIRATSPEPLSPEVAWRVGMATAQFLRSMLRGYDRSEPAKSTVIVGRDVRKTSAALAEALSDGLREGGSPVVDIGLIDTPQLYFAVNRLVCCGGVQVTASHNPPQYNGFKICGQKARPVSADTGLTQICKIAQNTIRHQTGQVADLCRDDLTSPYREFVRGFLTPTGGGFNPDRPMKVVVDASNGMAGRWLPLIFGDIPWLEIIRLNFEHNGDFVHDPDPLVESNLEQLRDRMKRSAAHLGVCFDSDADRMVVLDEQARLVRSDLLTALLARRFLEKRPGSTVIYDLRSSRAVAEEITAAGGVPRRERCGHTFIKKALADSRGLFAGELSGHFYFRDNNYCDSGMIAFAEVINMLVAAGKPLSELAAPVSRYAHSGELNFTNPEPREVFRRLAERYPDARIDYLDGITIQYEEWWCNVRSSNTEPLLRLNLEAHTPELLRDMLDEIAPLLGEPVTKKEPRRPGA